MNKKPTESDDEKLASSQEPTEKEETKLLQGKKKKRKRNRKNKKSFRNNANVSTPQSIVEKILTQTQYEQPNLSMLVEKKFSAPDYKSELERQLQKISYVDTVLTTEVVMAIMPTGYDDAKVNVSPFALRSLARPEQPIAVRKLLRSKNKEKNKKVKGSQQKRKNNGGNNLVTETLPEERERNLEMQDSRN